MGNGFHFVNLRVAALASGILSEFMGTGHSESQGCSVKHCVLFCPRGPWRSCGGLMPAAH